MTDPFDKVLALTHEQKETECRLDLVEERATIERQVTRAFADSLVEFGSLYAELVKC